MSCCCALSISVGFMDTYHVVLQDKQELCMIYSPMDWLSMRPPHWHKIPMVWHSEAPCRSKREGASLPGSVSQRDNATVTASQSLTWSKAPKWQRLLQLSSRILLRNFDPLRRKYKSRSRNVIQSSALTCESTVFSSSTIFFFAITDRQVCIGLYPRCTIDPRALPPQWRTFGR